MNKNKYTLYWLHNVLKIMYKQAGYIRVTMPRRFGGLMHPHVLEGRVLASPLRGLQTHDVSPWTKSKGVGGGENKMGFNVTMSCLNSSLKKKHIYFILYIYKYQLGRLQNTFP